MKVEEFIANQKQHSDNILSKLKEYGFLSLYQKSYSDIEIFMDGYLTTLVFDTFEDSGAICLSKENHFKTEEEIMKFVNNIPEINQRLREKKLERICK